MKTMNQLLGITHDQSPAYTPQVIGKTERSHRELMTRLKKVAGDHYENWTLVLPLVTMSQNLTIGARTNASPYQMIFGHNILLPQDALIASSLEQCDDRDIYLKRLLMSLQKGLLDARESSQEYVQKMLNQNKSKPKNTPTFEYMDLVWIYHPDSSAPNRKATKNFRGPYYILEKISDSRFRIGQYIGSKPLKGIISIHRLRKCVDRHTYPPMPTQEEIGAMETEPTVDSLKDETTSLEKLENKMRIRDDSEEFKVYHTSPGVIPGTSETDIDTYTTQETPMEIPKKKVIEQKPLPQRPKLDRRVKSKVNYNDTDKLDPPEKNSRGEYSLTSIEKILGKSKAKPIKIVVKFKNGLTAAIDKCEFESDVSVQMHNTHTPILSQQQIRDIID